MHHFTLETVEREICEIQKCSLTARNLELFNHLCKARKYLAGMSDDFGEKQVCEWVAKMDPPAKWTMEQTTAVMRQKNYAHDPCEFWAVMCMLYSDYGKTLAKYNADKPEVWADMADAWINDPDVRPGKTARYWREIAAR